MDRKPHINVIRLNGGKPILQADPDGWDNRFTLNPTALYLERSPKNDQLIANLLGRDDMDDPRLSDGAVVIYYRGVPHDEPGLPSCRSSIGLAVFTPRLELLKRFPHPVLSPENDPLGYDYNGTEDQRITRIGDTFYLVYCGWVIYPCGEWKVSVCMAESDDLVNWRKLGPVKGNVNDAPNKDAVILPEPVNGHYVMFHRPCVGQQSEYSVALAVSDSPTGVWTDCGIVMRPFRHPRYTESWIGMGASPLRVDGNVFLADYHTGNYLASGERDYFASYALLDFSEFDPEQPESIVSDRCEAVLVPETPYELDSPWPHDKTLNCVFPCGSYEYENDIYMIYGGADAYVLAARVPKDELIHRNDGLRLRGSERIWACPSLAMEMSRS